MTLRARLILALLALALIPTAVFTAFTLDALNRATERWVRPGVERALDGALEVSKTALTRMEAGALGHADDWAATTRLGPLDARARAAQREALRDAGLDFVQIYQHAGGRWRLDQQIVIAGVLAVDRLDLSAELDSAFAAHRVVHSSLGALAAVSRMRGEEALVTGLWLPRDYFDEVENVGQGLSHYRQLGVLADVQGRYVWLLVSALVAVLIGLAVTLATSIARQISRPIRELTGAFERVAAGDLEARVRPGGARELRSLSESFNTMAERLAEAREGLRLAEREAAWREVARRLAHEIKNPLTPMRLSLHRLERRVEAVPEPQRVAVRESLEAMLQEVDHLARLAEQFSQYARLPEPRFERVDLADVARAAVALYEPEQVGFAAGGTLPVWGDRLLLTRAIQNLVLNACEASPAGARVEVRAQADDGRAVVEVSDRGQGLPESERERLFEPYVSTKNRGSGLGLSLVRDVAQQHQAEVTLENREGGGARARLAVPLMASGGGEAANP